MKLSKSTLDILKNFSNINQSICFKKGTELSTLSIQKNILSRAEVEETFPKNFAIYDLSEFLSGLTLFEDPEFDFSNDSFVTIKDRRNTSAYSYECKLCTIKRILKTRKVKNKKIDWEYPDW